MAKRMQKGGFVGKTRPDEERPMNERLAEREFRGEEDEESSVRAFGIGGRGGPAGTTGYAKVSGSVPLNESTSLEAWVSGQGSSRFKNTRGAGVGVSKNFSRGGVVDPWNYKK